MNHSAKSGGELFIVDNSETEWKGLRYLYDITTGKILEQPEEIVAFIRSTPETPRRVSMAQPDLHTVRLIVEKHIKNTYLKQVQAPVGVKPELKCWMELS